MGRFEGKTAIVTGASRGIGREIAILLGREGARVAVNYSGSREKAEEVVQLIKDSGSDAFAIQANVSDADQVKQMIDATMENFGSIDFLINNAGITRDNLLMR